MIIAGYILSGLIAAVAIASALADFTHHPRVIESLQRLGFKPGFEQVLGAIKMVGAFGIIAGIRFRPLGIVATECVALYFLCATLAHLRVKDPVRDIAPAALLMSVAVAAALTHIAA